jgi:hypothetical protein
MRRGETTVLFAVIAVSAGYPNEVAGEGNQRQGYGNRKSSIRLSYQRSRPIDGLCVEVCRKSWQDALVTR